MTYSLHVQAERSGFVADMLHGRANLAGYILYLRNLAPAYQQLELAMERHRSTPGIGVLALPQVYRSAALAADLAALWGQDWGAELPFLPAARDYAECIARAATGDGAGLIGHAYVRYFGDLNGGQVLRRLLSASLDLPAGSLSSYDFPAIADLGEFRRSYREALDRSGEAIARWDGVFEAAVGAFSMNIEISEAVRRATFEPGTAGALSR